MSCPFIFPRLPLRAIVSFCSLILFYLSSCEEEKTDAGKQEYTIVSTLAGSDAAGFADGARSLASFNHPCGIAVDAGGNLYVADHSNHSIRMVTPEGVVSTFAGTGQPGDSDGHRLEASFNLPYGLALDAAGNLYVGDVGNHRIRKISTDGSVSTLAGSRKGFSDRPGELAMFNHPHGVAVDRHGNVYVADSQNNRIRKITPDGTTSTVAGNGNDGFVDGAGDGAEFYVPIGIVIDSEGNLYVGDEGNSSVRKISRDGRVATLAGNGKFSFADGVGRDAIFNAPGGIAIDAHGNLYVADYMNNCIRKIGPGGQVRKIAGNLKKGFADGPPAEARFYYPFGIAVDHAGVVYVGDQFNHRIRKID